MIEPNNIKNPDEIKDPNATLQLEIKKRNEIHIDENMIKNSKLLKIPLKLPKLIIPSLDFIVFITKRTQNDLLTEFVVHELESYTCDYDTLILSIVEKSGFIERLKVGLNQYFGEIFSPDLDEDNGYEIESLECETINLELEFPEKLFNFIEEYCNISKISKETFLTSLIMNRLSYICSSPEVILDYVNNSDKFFAGLKEGVKDYYGDTIYQKEKNKNGVNRNDEPK